MPHLVQQVLLFNYNQAHFKHQIVLKVVVAGIYSITVKDIDGCTKTKEVTINQGGTIGNNFLVVKDLLNMLFQLAMLRMELFPIFFRQIVK